MSSSRRCGLASFVVLAILIFLAGDPFALSQAITMVQSGARSAGSSSAGFNGDFGPATTISFNNPSYIAFDSNGNQFISDTLNNCVRKIDTSGNVTTVAGLIVPGQGDTCNTSSSSNPTASQGLYHPAGLAIDSSDRLYIADSMHHCVRALASSLTGTANLITVIGPCGSVATSSITPQPNGITIDGSGNLYIAVQDSLSAIPVNQVVHHSLSTGPTTACIVAGAASMSLPNTCAGVTNGVTLTRPSGVAVNVNGDLFIADTGNDCIREVAGLASGTTHQATVVGQCINDGTGTSDTAIHNPYAVAVSPMQSLYISQSNPDNIVSFVLGSSSIKLIAGLPSGIAGPYASAQDGQSALNSPLNGPRGIAFDSTAHLFVADSLNNITRALSSNLHFPNTPVGSPSSIQPITFMVNQAVNLTAAASGDYSVTSSTCSGSLSPAAPGAAPNTCQIFVRFTPTRPGLRRAPLTINDSISGSKNYQGLHAVGMGALSIFTPGATSTAASSLATPTSIVTDSFGNAYVLEAGVASGKQTTQPDIRLIPVNGGASSIVVSSGLVTPTAIAIDAAGNGYVADATQGTVTRFGLDGSVNASYVTGLDNPVALYVDILNNLYIAQAGSSHNVVKVFTSGMRTVIAGSGSNTAADGVAATTAVFVSPSAITQDLNGILYIADQGGHRVYAIDQHGIIHITAGNGTATTTVVGQAIGTAIVSPSSLALDAAGDLYIADQSSGIIYTIYVSTTAGKNIATVLNLGASAARGGLNIALDASGNLFLSETAKNLVAEVFYPNPTLDFGTITPGSTSAVKTQTVTNIGTDDLNITSPFSTTDSHFAVDSSSTTCGTSIQSGSVCSIGFTFTPSAGASYSATSLIGSNSYNQPRPIALIGMGSGKGLITPTVVTPAQTETYGAPFGESFTFGNITTAPTGTVVFISGTHTLCTLTGTFNGPSTCNAAASGLAVGTYTVTFNYSGDQNYNQVSGITTLVVSAAPLTVSANNASRTYGVANPTFTGTAAGLISGDNVTVTYSTSATTNSPVGTYPIVPTVTGAAASNYSITINPGTLTITANATSLVVNVNGAARTYAAPNPAFSGVVNGVLPGDNVVVTYTTPATTTSNAGSYPIGASISGTSAGNYIATIHPGTLVVAKATTTTAVTTSAPSAAAGATVTFTANVTANSGTAVGPVSFFDGTTLIGTANLNSSAVATLTTAALSIGSHTISASFPGTANFTSSSATVPQLVASATGNFTISANPPYPFIKGAGSTVFQVTVNSVGTFAGPVALTCAGLPADATCTFANPTVTLTAGGSATTAMTVTTTVADAKLEAPGLPPSNADLTPITVAAMFPAELTGLGFLFAGLRRRKPLGTQKMRLLAVIVFSLGILGLVGCGCISTTFKQYTITVTGTSTSFPAPAQSTSVLLSVGQ